MPATRSSSATTASCLSELWRRSTVARWKPNTCTARAAAQARREQRAAVGAQARVDPSQVGEECSGRCVGRRGADGGALLVLQPSPRAVAASRAIDADQRAPVGLVLAVRGAVGRALGQRLQPALTGRAGRDRKLRAELVHLGEVVAKARSLWRCSAASSVCGGDERVAVAVAADPVAHARRTGARRSPCRAAGHRVLDVGDSAGICVEEGGVGSRLSAFSISSRTVSFAVRSMRVCQSWREPAQLASLASRSSGRASRDRGGQLGDGALGVEDALALHLGRMCGEHRRARAPPRGDAPPRRGACRARAHRSKRPRSASGAAACLRGGARGGGARGGGPRRCWRGARSS